MAQMLAFQVSRPGGSLEMVERAVPDPGAGMVRIKIDACGPGVTQWKTGQRVGVGYNGG